MESKTITPKEITPQIIELCNSICKNQKPIYIANVPEVNTQNECFQIVNKKVAEFGGSIQHGWAIWHWPEYLIESEFHAVWITPEGTFLNITPTFIKTSKILFLPDPLRKYEGKQVDNIRVATSNNPLITDLIDISAAIFRFNNKGKRAYQREIVLEGVEIQIFRWLNESKLLIEKMMGEGLTRNSLCLCGSGERYKRCHGKKLAKNLNYI